MKKLQVFVSSTYKDLIEERQAAVEAILDAGHIPAGMELFRAGKTQMETIKKWIDDSDVYCLILGGRYGTIEEGNGKSYTQMEYEYAISKGKPLFAIVLKDAMLLEKVKREGEGNVFEKNHVEKYKEFRQKVESNIVKYVNNIFEISGCIALELNSILNNQSENLSGWVKGTTDIELLRLNEKLKKTPQAAQLYVDRAKHLFSTEEGDLQQAVSDCLYAIFLEPDRSDFYYELINHLLEKKDRSSALKLAEEACRLFPNDGRAYEYRAYAKYYKGLYNEGIEDCNKAMRMLNDSWNYDIRGRCYVCLGQYRAALDDFVEENLLTAQQELVAVDILEELVPRIGIAQIFQMAWEEKKQKNYDKAEAYFRVLMHFVPNDEQVIREIGGIYYDQGQYAKALQYWEKALSFSHSCRNYYLCAIIYKWENNHLKAREYCEFALSRPDDGYHGLARDLIKTLDKDS